MSVGCRTMQVISTARTCDLILIVLDCLKPLTHKRLIEHELEVRPRRKCRYVTKQVGAMVGGACI